MIMKDDLRVFYPEVQLYVVEVVLHLVLLFTCATNMSAVKSVVKSGQNECWFEETNLPFVRTLSLSIDSLRPP